ncbi:mannose-6-phosphate isomerase 1 [Nicotiana attenuata]|uniref:mannose-6-phosphate isomerase n=1 Tax=Nicotiana attenuata TaxID=49451 RepID=A0A1J6KEK7_NICAT|nr:mannose-6-phosphate isomerase 1 [Nicotiana attenuata]
MDFGFDYTFEQSNSPKVKMSRLQVIALLNSEVVLLIVLPLQVFPFQDKEGAWRILYNEIKIVRRINGELKLIVQTVPEIIEVVGNARAEQVLDLNEDGEKEKVKLVLQSVFTEVMSARKDMIAEVIAKLISRLHIKNQARQLIEKEQVVLRLEKQYPADVGVLATFLLNYVKLKPGEALYLGENEPHAYIYGDCVEVMATSDNVVRDGLTPKHWDVKTLCSMLTYRQGFPEILNGTAVNPHTMRERKK